VFIWEQENFRAVLRAAGETETAQGNVQDWLQLAEGDPGLQFLTGRNCYNDIFIFIFISSAFIIKFLTYFFLGSIFCIINQELFA
jgi:hypothetical protein